MNNFKDFGIKPEFPMSGTRESINNVKDKPIIVLDYRYIRVQDKDGSSSMSNQFKFTYVGESVDRIVFTRSDVVRRQMEQFTGEYPFLCTFKVKDNALYIE